MKMENNINADKDGKITAINVNKGTLFSKVLTS